MFRNTLSRMAFRSTPALLVQTGKIVSFNRQKGFGFVEEGGGDSKKSHFVHYTALNVEGGYKAVDVGTTVEFDVAPDERNPDRTRAVNVCAPGGQPLPTPERQENFGGGRGGGDRGGRGRGGGFRGGRGRGGGDRGGDRRNYQDDF